MDTIHSSSSTHNSGTPQSVPAPESPAREVAHTLHTIRGLNFEGGSEERAHSNSRSPRGGDDGDGEANAIVLPQRRGTGKGRRSLLWVSESPESHLPSLPSQADTVAIAGLNSIRTTTRTLDSSGLLRGSDGTIIRAADAHTGLGSQLSHFTSTQQLSHASQPPLVGATPVNEHAAPGIGSTDITMHAGPPPGLSEDAVNAMVATAFKLDPKVLAQMQSIAKETLAAMRSEEKSEARVVAAKAQLTSLRSGRIPSGTKPFALPFTSSL